MLRRLLVVGVSVALSVACATSPISPANLAKLTPVISTRSDAETILGPPSSVSDYGNGSTLVQWIDASAAGGGHIAILFMTGGNREMVRVTHQFFTRR